MDSREGGGTHKKVQRGGPGLGLATQPLNQVPTLCRTMAELPELPDWAVALILHHAGVLTARRSGWAGVSQMWRRVLSEHPDWEEVCDAEGLYHITRPDDMPIQWGAYYLSWAESQAEQIALMRAVLLGHNVFLTGSGGSGKTSLINVISASLREDEGRAVHVTATTGMAATLIGGTTIQRWAGVGLGKEPVRDLLRKLGSDARRRIRTTDVLIVDESSMLDPDLFDKYDEIAKRVRGEHSRLFGGIQLILSADFFQLPPINPEGQYRFLFQHPKFERGIDDTFVFRHVYRATDALFAEILARVRSGDTTLEDIEILRTRMHKPLEEAEALGVLPTRMYSHKANVQSHNNEQLALLPGEPRVWAAESRISRRNVEGDGYSRATHSAASRGYNLGYVRALQQMESSCPVQSTMVYKDGAQVMLTVNLDPDSDLVNGSRGVVVDGGAHGSDKGIEVQFANGVRRVIGRFTWSNDHARGDRGEDITLKYKQIPLALAWAYTIHKSQGATLDCAIMDLGSRVFQEGMSYVSLSRVRSLFSLSLEALDPNAIRADPLVKAFYAYIDRNGTHKGFSQSISHVIFPTAEEMFALVRQLPEIKERRDAARRLREQQEQQEQEPGQRKRPADDRDISERDIKSQRA